MEGNELDVRTKAFCDGLYHHLQMGEVAKSPQGYRPMPWCLYEDSRTVNPNSLDECKISLPYCPGESFQVKVPNDHSIVVGSRDLVTEVEEILRVVQRRHFVIDRAAGEGWQQVGGFAHLIVLFVLVASFEERRVALYNTLASSRLDDLG